MKPSPGMRLSFSYLGQSLEGVLVNEEDGRLVIKLTSGYNIIVDPSDLKAVKEQKVPAKRKAAAKAAATPSGLPQVAILHTGGTVASRVDYETGAVVAKYTAEELLGLYPELLGLADMRSRLIRNMMSDDMRFGHYNLIAEAVMDAVAAGAKGVIVTHGTDTLHYTAAALGFMLENLPVPVVVVGSQRSSDRGSSDAASNLTAAVRYILAERGGGVTVCMHAGTGDDAFRIIDGFRARKMHSSRRDAFRSVNATPVATVERGEVRIARPLPRPTGELALHPFNERLAVGMLYVHPNMDAEEFAAYEGFDGLVLLGTGLGHAPITAGDELTKGHEKNYEAIAALSKHMPVAMASQTIYGRINMDVYSPGRKLQEAGVLGQGLDMPPETAFIKLAWLLSNHRKDARRLYGENLRGELSERSEENGFPE